MDEEKKARSAAKCHTQPLGRNFLRPTTQHKTGANNQIRSVVGYCQKRQARWPLTPHDTHTKQIQGPCWVFFLSASAVVEDPGKRASLAHRAFRSILPRCGLVATSDPNVTVSRDGCRMIPPSMLSCNALSSRTYLTQRILCRLCTTLYHLRCFFGHIWFSTFGTSQASLKQQRRWATART